MAECFHCGAEAISFLACDPPICEACLQQPGQQGDSSPHVAANGPANTVGDADVPDDAMTRTAPSQAQAFWDRTRGAGWSYQQTRRQLHCEGGVVQEGLTYNFLDGSTLEDASAPLGRKFIVREGNVRTTVIGQSPRFSGPPAFREGG